MKLHELKQEIQKYQYFEDTGIIDIALASVIATRLQLRSPVWLVVIGASSGGKSQILRPLSLTDKGFMHRVDDLTENTFLSGMAGGDSSLLNRIGNLGMLVLSDMTVLFSKNAESRNAILSQFRMIFDGEMIKYVGTKKEPLRWHGSLGILAGSTPSIYAHFEEVADMGERFIYYRMKDYSAEKATRLALSAKVHGHKLDEILSDVYSEYIEEVVKNADTKALNLSETENERIMEVAMFAEKVRTPIHTDWEGLINKIPVPAMPMRVAKQLAGIATSLSIMRNHEEGTYKLSESDLYSIEWCAYSLANEEKRYVLKVLGSVAYMEQVQAQVVADKMGMPSKICLNILENLNAVGVLKRDVSMGSLSFAIKERKHYDIIRRMEGISSELTYEKRELAEEEMGMGSKGADVDFPF